MNATPHHQHHYGLTTPPTAPGVIPAPALRASIHPSGTPGITVLRLAGELDLTGITLLTAALDQVVVHGQRAAVIDVSALDFCSVRGFSTLAAAADRAATAGIEFLLVGRSPHQARVHRIITTADPAS